MPKFHIHSTHHECTYKDKVSKAFSYLDTVPNKILTLLKHDASYNVSNSPFSSGVFIFLFKIPKVVPVYDKDSRLGHGNYRPISLL